jgi:hypothetical protein
VRLVDLETGRRCDLAHSPRPDAIDLLAFAVDARGERVFALGTGLDPSRYEEETRTVLVFTVLVRVRAPKVSLLCWDIARLPFEARGSVGPALPGGLLDAGVIEAAGPRVGPVLAAQCGQVEALRRFLDGGVSPDAASEPGRRPLLAVAAEAGWPEVVSLLLERGADANRADAAGLRPLDACTGGAPAAPLACEGREECHRRLVKAGARPAVAATPTAEPAPSPWLAERESDLHAAVARGRLDLVRRALATGADPNAPDAGGRAPIIVALGASRSDVVRLLLARGARPNVRSKEGLTPLHPAAASLDDKLVAAGVEALLAHGADPNAVFESSDPNLRAWHSETPLLTLARVAAVARACPPGRLRAVEMLLARGARTDVRDSLMKRTALEFARDSGVPALHDLLERRPPAE